MIIKPSVERMLEIIDDRYDLSMAVAKRARQIIEKRAEEENTIDQRDSVKIAIDEIESGKLKVKIEKSDNGEENEN